MKPCITTWPAYVPTLERRGAGGEQRDRERERGAAADQLAEAGWAPSIVSTPVCPDVWNSCGGDREHRHVDHARRGPAR